MKKINLLLAILLLLGANAFAESSSGGYSNPPVYNNYQVFVQARNNSQATIARDKVVVIDNGAGTYTVNSGTVGGDVTTTQTSDSVFVYGVTDESIAAGAMGRVCIRGPHKAVSLTSNASSIYATGTIISASSTTGTFGPYSTSDGTAGGRLGYVLNTTATSDTGDASNTFWIWVEPARHK